MMRIINEEFDDDFNDDFDDDKMTVDDVINESRADIDIAGVAINVAKIIATPEADATVHVDALHKAMQDALYDALVALGYPEY